MIPLTVAEKEKELIIKRVVGTDEVRRHLEDLGFTPGSKISVINSLNGNLIIKVKESRVAVDESLARKIMI